MCSRELEEAYWGASPPPKEGGAPPISSLGATKIEESIPLSSSPIKSGLNSTASLGDLPNVGSITYSFASRHQEALNESSSEQNRWTVSSDRNAISP